MAEFAIHEAAHGSHDDKKELEVSHVEASEVPA